MLSELPSEIIYLIATYLPTASSIAHLLQTCRRLHEIISAPDSGIYRVYLQRKFPGVQTPSLWRDAVQALSSRSRAIDKHGIIVRFVLPPKDATEIGPHNAVRRDNPTIGYRPAIDSYEVWTGDRWADRREALVWGAADELMIRIQMPGAKRKTQWATFSDLNIISSHDDICGVHLLRPEHYPRENNEEHVFVGRMSGDLFHLMVSPDKNAYEYKQTFRTFGLKLNRTDLSNGPEPILAAHLDNELITLYRTSTEDAEVDPFFRLSIGPGTGARHVYSKFLSRDRIAVGPGPLSQVLSISAISPSGLSTCHEINLSLLDLEGSIVRRDRSIVTAIAPLTSHAVGGNSGDVFLAGWGDRTVRLHDLRSNAAYEARYRDTTNTDPIYCLLPFGHDRFIAGVGGDGLLKIFDLRMQRTSCNSDYLDATSTASSGRVPALPSRKMKSFSEQVQPRTQRRPSTEFSLFLLYGLFTPTSAYAPRNRRENQRRRYIPHVAPGYRGPVYELSSPSSSSATVYAGVVNGVARLDFASTDDLTGSCSGWYRENLNLDLDVERTASSEHRILDISGYERPDPEDTLAVAKLRRQKPLRDFLDGSGPRKEEEGWDLRWRSHG